MLSSVPEDDAVLIDGPYLSGKRRLFHALLRTWTDEPVITSTRHVADRMRTIHRQAAGCPDTEPVVVDCVSGAHVDSPEETERTRYATGPGNLTSIGTTVTEVLESRREEELAVGIASLSPILMYASTETAFQFTQLLVQQTTGQGWPIAAVVESEAHDDPEHHALRQPFDVVIETRPGVDGTGGAAVDGIDGTVADGPSFRIRDREEVTDWKPVSSV